MLALATDFLAFSILTLLMPVCLLIGLAVWHTGVARNVARARDPAGPAARDPAAGHRRGTAQALMADERPERSCRRGLAEGPGPWRWRCWSPARSGSPSASAWRSCTLPRRVRSRAPALHGEATWAPGARPAPAIARLRDQSGRAFSLAALRGHTVVIAFLDSHCTAACPLEGRALAAAEQTLASAQRPGAGGRERQPARHPGQRPRGSAQVGTGRPGGVALADGIAPRSGPRVGGLPDLGPDSRPRRHRAHRGALPARPPRRRALGLSVSVRARFVRGDLAFLSRGRSV